MAKKVSRFSSTIDNQTNLQNITDRPETLSPEDIAAGVQNRMDGRDIVYGNESNNFGLVSQQLSNQQTHYTTPTVIGIGDLPGPKKMGESKYDFGLRMEDAIDIDETRGQRQTNWDKFGNGVIKNLLGKTATNVVGGIAGTVYGLGSALINLDFDKMYDNEFARLLDDTNEWMDGKMPHYYTRAEMQEESLLKRMGSANFIYDQVTNGFSFLAGAVITEMLAAAAMPFTGGTSLMANHVRLTATAARQLKKLDRARRMTTLASRYRQASKAKAGWQALKIGRQILTGANYESGIEARAHYDELMEGLVADWKAQPENEGLDIPQDKMDEFEITARKTSNAVYGVNLALVGGSNMLMIPQLYGPGAALKSRMMGGLNKLGFGIGRQTGKVAGKSVGRYASMGKLGNFLGMGEKTQRVLGKTWQTAGLLKTPFYEGFVEEGLQSSIGMAAYDYGMMTSSSESKKATADWLSSVYYGIHETYNNAEGQSEIALGMILGAIGLPGVSGGIRSEYKGMKAKRTVQDLIADRYNDNPGMLQSMTNSAKFFNEQQQLIRLMDQALMDDNMAAFKDLEHDYFFSYVKSRHESGFFEDIIEDAEAIKEMGDEEFLKFTGYNENDFSSKEEIQARKNKVADSAISRAKKIKEALDLANQALVGPGQDLTHTHTNEDFRKIRDRVAHQLSVAENVEERMDSLKGTLAEKTGGKLVVQGRGKTLLRPGETIPYTERTGFRTGTETLSPGITFNTLSKKGVPTTTTIPFGNMHRGTFGSLLKEVNIQLDQDAQLSPESENKLSPEERAKLEVQKAVMENILKDEQLSELTPEELAFLDLALGNTSENKQLIELAKEDPVQFAKEIDEILDILKDMRHLRARRQTAIQTYNQLMQPEHQQRYIQQLERFVDDNMKEEVPRKIIEETGNEEVAELFRQFGTTTEFRPYMTYGTREDGTKFEEEGRMVQFDEFGLLYDPNNPMDKIDYKSLKGIGLNRITTQEQREARKALQAIKNIKENEKVKLQRVLKQIKDTENEVFQELIALEETYGTDQEIAEQLKTGRKKGKFLGKKYLGELKGIRDRVRGTIETGEALIKEYELEARELEDSIEYLHDLMVAHFNPNTRTFDIDLDNRFISERLNRLDLMSKELGIEIDPNKEEISSDLELAQEYVSQITSDLGEYISQTDLTIESLSTKLGELSEYQDILEKTLFDRLRQSKHIVLNKHVTSNNMNYLYGEIVKEITNFITSEESREDYMGTEDNPYRDEVLNPGESTVATKRMQLETLKELPNYRAYRNFINQNGSDFFWELRDFLSQLDIVEKDLNDVKFLKAEVKSTSQEIAEIKELLDSVITNRKAMDAEQQLKYANEVLQAIEYEKAYNKILPAIAQIEAELLTPISEGLDTQSPEENSSPTNINTKQGVQIDHLGDSEFNDQYEVNDKKYGKTYRRSWADNPYNGTAGNQTVNKSELNRLSTPESLLEGNPVMKEGEDPVAFKRALYGATWYKYTENYFNYKTNSKGEVAVMAIHSGNVNTLPADMQEELKDLFVEDEVTPEGADIKLILVNRKTQKPIRDKKFGNRLVLTSMTLPYSETTGNEKYTRFDNRGINLSADILDEMVQSHVIFRSDILKEGKTHSVLPINRVSPGYSARVRDAEGKVQVFPASGRLFGANRPDVAQKVDIRIPVKPNPDGSSQIEHAGLVFWARPGMPVAIHKGNVHPLKTRIINKSEAESIINLLRKQEQDISQARLEGYEKRSEAWKHVKGKPLLGEDGTVLTEKSYYDIINDLMFTGLPKEGAPDSSYKYQFYFDTKRGGYVFGSNGFISTKQLLDNEADPVERLRTFLIGDGTKDNLGKTLHTNKSTLDKSLKDKKSVPFEEVVFKRLDNGNIVIDVENSKLVSNGTNWANYREYLLDSSPEKGRSESNVPPLRVSIPAMTNSVMDTQTDYRYVVYGLNPTKREHTPNNTNYINPNPSSPQGVIYTETQKKDIVQVEQTLGLASRGQKIEVETPMGSKMLVDPTPGRIIGNYIAEAPGGHPGQTLGLKKDATIQNAVDAIQKYLDEYKNNTYNVSFAKYINQRVDGKVVDPIDSAQVKTNEQEAIVEPEVEQIQEDKANEIPEFTETGQIIPDFEDMISQIEKNADILDPNVTIDVVEKTAEELQQAKDERQQKLDDLNLDSLDTENPDGVAESLVKDLNMNLKYNKEWRESAQSMIDADMKNMFPKMKVEYVENFMTTLNGPAQGRVTEYGRIMVATMAEAGIEYHEAWHQVSLYMLPRSEAKALFDEVRNQSGEVITYKGVQKEFSKLTDKEADEWLAGEFRQTVLTSGAYQVGSNRIKNWFRRMLDFIVNFVTFGLINLDSFRASSGIFGQGGLTDYTSKTYKIAKFFDRVRFGEFASTKQHPDAIGGTAESLTLGSTVKFDMDIISSLDKYLADTLFNNVKEGGLHLADLGNLGNKETNKIFEQELKASYLTSIKRMLGDLNQIIDIAPSPELKQAATRHFDTIMGRMGTLVKMHREHLSDIGVNFEVNYEELAEDETARIDKDSASNMFNAMEFSTRDMAPSIVKFMLSTLPSGTRNASLLKGSVDFADTINFIQDKLAGTQSFDEQINILQRYVNKKPWIKSLFSRLGVLDGLSLEGKNLKDVIIQNSFFNQFAKQKNDFITQLIDSDGNIYSTDTNKTRLNDLIADPWRANLLSNPTGIAKLQDGKILIDPVKRFTIAPGILASIRDIYNKPELRKLVKGEGAIAFLKQLGIVFTNPARLLSTEADISDEKSNVDILNESTAWIIQELNRPRTTGEVKADIFDTDNLDVGGRLGSLMKLEALDNDTAIELQHFTPDGKVVYGITLNTYLSIVANSNGGTKGISKYLDPTHNLYTRHSRIVKSLEKGAKMRILVQQGTAIAGIGDRGIKTEKLSPSDQISGIVNDTLNGKARFLRAADQSVEYVIGMPGGALTPTMTADIFKGYLIDELAVSQSKKGKEFSRFREVEGLRIFKNIVGDIANDKMQAELELIKQGKGLGTPVIEQFMGTYWESAIQPALQTYFDNQAVDNLNLWEQHKIINRQANGQYTILGIDKPTASKIIGEKSDTYSRSQILKLAKLFSINYMSNNIEQFKVFLGDPAFYKGLFKRTKMSAGTKELSRTDNYLNDWLNAPENMRSDGRIADGTEEIMVFNDPVVVSDYLREYTKILGKNAQPYSEIEEGDAVAWSTLDAYREFSIRTNDWSPNQEQLYWQITKGQKNTLTKDEMASFPVKKPQYMGPQITADGQFAPFGMKISLAPLLPHMLKDPNTGQPTQLNKLNNDLQANSIGIALFPSGAKFGHRVDSKTGEGTDFYKSDGTISDVNPVNISTIDYKFFGKQQNISPKTHSKTTTGTQKRTLMKSDLFQDGVPVDYLPDYSMSDRTTMWNSLSDSMKLEVSPVHNLIREYDILYNGLTVKAKDNLLNRFGIKESNGEYILEDKDYAQFGRVIKNELSRRNMPRALKDGVEWILDESPEKLFDMLINKGRLESLLFSLINNNILSQKMIGDMSVQTTSTGMEVEARVVKQVGNRTILSSGSSSTKLKFYEMENWNDPNSKTLGMEVFLPHFFKEYLGENLIIRPDGIYNEAGKLVADVSLLDVIGFRIPTDGLHSIEFIKVKGFLSKDGGSQVIVPSELPAKTGSDYDIDKLSMYFPAYVNTNGILTKRTMINADTTTDEGLRKYYDVVYGPTLNFFKELDRDLAEAKDNTALPYDPDTDKLLTSIFGENALEYTEEELTVLMNRFKSLENSSKDQKLKFAEDQYENIKKRIENIPPFTEWKKDNYGKSVTELNHIGAIQNRIMDISKEILEHSRSRYSLLNPISTDVLGYDNGLAGDIRQLKGLSRRPDNISYDEMITLSNVSKTMETFLTGKDNVSIEAVNVTHHVKSQQAGLYIKPEQVLQKFGDMYKVGIFLKGFENTMGGGAISLANVKALDGQLISDSLSQLVNAFIDVSNDPFIFELNFNPRTSNAWNFLVRSGVPIKHAAYLMNQPVILKLINEIQVNDSKFLVASNNNKGVGKLIESLVEELESKIVSEYKYHTEPNSSIEAPKAFDIETLEAQINKDYSEMSQEELKDQLQILNNYRMYDAIGGELTSLIQVSSQDTKKINNRAHAKIMEAKYNQVITNGIFGNIDNLFENTLMHEFRNTHLNTSKMFNEMFFTERTDVKDNLALNQIEQIFTNPNMMKGVTNAEKAIQKAENDAIMYLLSDVRIDDQILSDKTKRFFLGENSIPKQLARIKQEGSTNILINKLTPLIATRQEGNLMETDNIKLLSKILNTYDQNLLLDSWHELYGNPFTQQFARDLLDFALLQSGLNNSPIAFVQYLPSDIYAKRALKVFKQFENKLDAVKSKQSDFFDKFFKNNWSDPNIVPRIFGQVDRFGKPNIQVGDPKGEYPYLAISKSDFASAEDQKWYKDNNVPIPKRIALYKRVNKRQYKDKNGKTRWSWNYVEVNKLGNGMQLKEYTHKEEDSIIPSNNISTNTAIVRSQDIPIELPFTLTFGLQEQIKKGNKKQIASPKNKLTSRLYNLSNGVKIRLEASKPITLGELDTMAKKNDFAQKEGYKNWDSLVSKIRTSNIPLDFLDGTRELDIFAISEVREPELAVTSVENQKETTVVINQTITPQNLDGFEVDGPLVQLFEESMSNLLDEQIAAGKRNFVVGMGHGTDLITAQLLRKKQLELAKQNKSIRIVAVLPYQGLEATFSEKDKTIFEQFVTKPMATFKQDGNEVRFVSMKRSRNLNKTEAGKLLAKRNNVMVELGSTILGAYEGEGGKMIDKANKSYTKENIIKIDMIELKEIEKIRREMEEESKPCNP